MAWPCKRIRLSASDDNDNNDDNDDKVVVAAVTDDVNTPFNKEVEVKTETTMTLPTTDDVDATSCLTPELKPNTIDLTIDSPPPANTRRSFPHTAEVIKARYTTEILIHVFLSTL